MTKTGKVLHLSVDTTALKDMQLVDCTLRIASAGKYDSKTLGRRQLNNLSKKQKMRTKRSFRVRTRVEYVIIPLATI
ncbi:Hypothetical protein FKW44_013941 [Caligus rogercresseyi]|uniref:Uncharacterized protein n=1 Tax=Caligus rogercresseyi TaxID=217165 RepID=A0A7T8GZ32_CALRO|nr:Hypothetical protein FKW44_013941 [Caligus rogercresseyi]